MRDIPILVSELEPDALMRLASVRTGLDDFGPDEFRGPLEILTLAMREEAALNAAGVDAMGERLVNALANRLRKTALLKAEPRILDEKIEMAALVVGLPRTGSTMLHRLLAASPKMTAVKWWESVFPLPRGEAGPAEESARQADAETLVEGIMGSASGFDAIHPLDAQAYDEELPLIEQSFISNMPESMMYLPSYGRWLLGADQSNAYRELIEYLKIIQWQSPERRGRKWVLKCPHHLTATRTVLDTFPDAVIVMTHRPIRKLMPSWYSMVASLTGAYSTRDYSREQAEHWTERLRQNLQDFVAVRSTAESRFVDVDYRDLLRQPLTEAGRVLTAACLEVGPSDIEGWETWLDANQRDNRPSHNYTLERFGISAQRLDQDFAFYTEAFPMAAEKPG